MSSSEQCCKLLQNKTRRTCVALGLTVQLLLPHSVFAQKTKEQPTEQGSEGAEAETLKTAKRLFERGVAHAHAERWHAAMEAFAQAWDLTQRPNIAFNLASAAYRLGHYVQAVEALENYTALAAPDDAYRPEAERLRAELESELVKVTFWLRPEDAELFVDGVKHEGSGKVRRFRTDPGSHDLRVQKDGFATVQMHVLWAAGSEPFRKLLLPLQAEAAGPPPSNLSQESSWSTLRWTGLGVAAGGGLGLGLAGVFSLMAIERKAAGNGSCTGNVCDDRGYDARKDAQRWSNAATVAAISGGALTAIGLTLFFVGDERDSSTAQWSPAFSPERIGLSYTGQL